MINQENSKDQWWSTHLIFEQPHLLLEIKVSTKTFEKIKHIMDCENYLKSPNTHAQSKTVTKALILPHFQLHFFSYTFSVTHFQLHADLWLLRFGTKALCTLMALKSCQTDGTMRLPKCLSNWLFLFVVAATLCNEITG